MESYLVTQATGQKSQWVIIHLVTSGVRHPSVTIFKGESIDYNVVLPAAQGCKGVFLNTFPIPGLETQQAKTIIEASKEAGVERVVASTTCSVNNREYWDNDAGRETRVHGYFESKFGVEKQVREAGFKAYTILRPVWLIHDYLLPAVNFNFPGFSTKGVLEHASEEGTKMLHTDSFDVGRYAAAALQDPTRFGGQEIALVDEALTIDEIRDILVRVNGREVPLRKRSREDVEQSKNVLFAQNRQLMATAKDISADPLKIKEVQAKFGISFNSFEVPILCDKARLLRSIFRRRFDIEEAMV